MVKKIVLLTLIISTLFAVGCKKKSKYDDHISQLRNDIFKFECADFTLTAYAENVETPLVDDGIKGKTENKLVFKLKNNNPEQNFENCSINFSLKGQSYSKNFEFKQIPTLLNCTVTVAKLPTSTFEVTLTINGKSQPISLKSVKNKSTKSYAEVLKNLKKEETFSKQLESGVEIRVRLINNDGYDYWYVGLINKEQTTSYLVDGETLEIIARKEDK